MWEQIKKVVALLIIILAFNSCTNQNKGEFIFYKGKTPIFIKDYDIYISNLDNIYLVIKDFNRRSYIINNKIDSLYYKVDNQIHKAELNKISGKFSKFHLLTQNDGSKLFINGCNKYHQEMLYLGQKEDLDFIVNNNKIIEQEE